MIHILTALPCEARPLIAHYGLNGRQGNNGFRIFENDRLRLIVAGVGKCAAAVACGYLQGAAPAQRHAWLNLGVAGHATLAAGTAVIAHKVSDAASGRCWYPPLLFPAPCPTLELITVERPENDYPDDAAYDMEAAGFYAAASRFSSLELLQAFKVISDNRTQPADALTAERVEALIGDRLDDIDALIQALTGLETALARQSTPPETLQPFLQRWHFSVAQQHQLQRLLQRWQALGAPPPTPDTFSAARNGKQVIAALRAHIDALPVSWP